MKKILVTLCFLLSCAFAQSGQNSVIINNQTYKTATFGGKTWMVQNLNVKVQGSSCYGNKQANCPKYGSLYTWDQAQEVCPEGWRLPTSDEWESSIASGNTGSYFSKALGGFKNAKGKFELVGVRADFWTASSEGEKGVYWYWSNKSKEFGQSSFAKKAQMSVRCIKEDIPEPAAPVYANEQQNTEASSNTISDNASNTESTSPKSSSKGSSDALFYLVVACLIASFILYIFIFVRSKNDPGLVLIAGGKSGLAVTVVVWIVFLIDLLMLSSNKGSTPPAEVVVAIICGIAIVASIVMAAIQSNGWQNRVFSVYGHLYTVMIALFIIFLIVGLFIVNWVSRKKNRYGEYVDSNDIFAVSARGLKGLLLRFVNETEI